MTPVNAKRSEAIAHSFFMLPETKSEFSSTAVYNLSMRQATAV